MSGFLSAISWRVLVIFELFALFCDVFGDDFPSLADEDCKLDEEDINNINKYKNKLSLNFARKCVTNVYDILKCPFIIYEKDNHCYRWPFFVR